MQRTDKHCEGCSETTEQVNFGFVPLEAVEDNYSGDAWVKTRVCTKCGSYLINEITESDVRRADERYIHLLLEENLITRQEASQILGLEE